MSEGSAVVYMRGSVFANSFIVVFFVFSFFQYYMKLILGHVLCIYVLNFLLNLLFFCLCLLYIPREFVVLLDRLMGHLKQKQWKHGIGNRYVQILFIFSFIISWNICKLPFFQMISFACTMRLKSSATLNIYFSL